MKINTIRHSLAHILATAVQELYPGTKFGIGPAIENGFYYDFDLPKNLAPAAKGPLRPRSEASEPRPFGRDNLPKIEKKMKELIKQNIVFKKKNVSKNEAKKIFKNQPYKLELIKELAEVRPPLRPLPPTRPRTTSNISIYQVGNFVDLCKGPHVKSTKEIPFNGFKLIKVAGAYWRGSEKNPMLTRIYGIAFETKKELENYLEKEKEAQKRDHRLLGQKLDLFHIDENIGPGLILWHPKGATLKRIIENYALNEYLKNGYQLVSTPHIAKLKLWEISGHTDFYKENMFPPSHMKEISSEEKEDYELKPMNCPFHIAIYKTRIRSYKEMPIRYTEMGTVYRYEKSGVLHGLTRVRGFTQDDAHVWCSPEQLSKEIADIVKFALKLLKKFGFKKYEIYLSTRPKKYVGALKNWQKATNSLKYALEKIKIPYQIDPGEGVFYGPKIDIKIKDSLGRAWQLTTIQVDFNLPERFDMTYIDKNGKKQQPIMIHRALLGSLERFIGVLLEYHGGNLPLWLTPVQILVIPVSSSHRKYADFVNKQLTTEGLRTELKDAAETVSKKIRKGELQKIPYLLVVGDKEMKTKSVRVRSQNKDLGKMLLTRFIEKVKMEAEKKK